MDNFKQYHSIETDITLQSKVENDHLFVFYKDQWIQLSYKKTQTDFTAIEHSENDTTAICAISLECTT